MHIVLTTYCVVYLSILVLVFDTHSLPETDTLYGADVVIFEGIFVLYDPEVRDMLDLMVFVEADDDIRLARRCKSLCLFLSLSVSFFFFLSSFVLTRSYSHPSFLPTRCISPSTCPVRRDIVERGRSVESVLTQYCNTVKPSYDDFIAPVGCCPFS
jgi:uridine kinase